MKTMNELVTELQLNPIDVNKELLPEHHVHEARLHKVLSSSIKIFQNYFIICGPKD